MEPTTAKKRPTAVALVTHAIATITAREHRKKTAAALAALLLAGGAYAYSEHTKAVAAARRAKRAKAAGVPVSQLQKHNGGGRRRSPQASLNSLVAYLLPLAGRKIIVLVALAILRTGLSNRLARLQVGVCICIVVVFVGVYLCLWVCMCRAVCTCMKLYKTVHMLLRPPRCIPPCKLNTLTKHPHKTHRGTCSVQRSSAVSPSLCATWLKTYYCAWLRHV